MSATDDRHSGAPRSSDRHDQARQEQPGAEDQSGAPGQGKLNPKVIGISIAAAVGGFLFGFDTSVINGAVSALSGEFSLGPP